MATTWKLSGVYFEACNCQPLCPCLFASAPSNPKSCTVFDHWHIEKGSFGKLDLGGLNVAMTVESPGHMLEVPWSVALYIDKRAREMQAQALETIFAGKAGGHLALLAKHVGKVRGVRRVPIAFRKSEKTRSVTIPKIASVAIEALAGQGGKPVTLANHPLAVAPGFAGTGARSKRFRVVDHGESWELSGGAALFSPFVYRGP